MTPQRSEIREISRLCVDPRREKRYCISSYIHTSSGVESHSSSIRVKMDSVTTDGDDTKVYDPESKYLDDKSINLNDPEEVAAHLHVQEVHRLYKQQRLNNIRRGVILAVLISVVLLAFIGSRVSGTRKDTRSSSSTSSGSSASSAIIPPPPSNLALLCSRSQLEASLQSYTQCQIACEVAECCSLPASFALSCLDGNQDTCATYNADCSLLQSVRRPSEGNVDSGSMEVTFPATPKPPSTAPISDPTPPPASTTKEEIDDACQNHSVAPGNNIVQPSLCAQVCDAGACCFDQSAAGCSGDNSFCSKYEACQVVFPATPTQPDSVITPEQLQGLCADPSPSVRAKCISKCAAATCCYSTTIAESCIHVNPSVVCSDYEACGVLYNVRI